MTTPLPRFYVVAIVTVFASLSQLSTACDPVSESPYCVTPYLWYEMSNPIEMASPPGSEFVWVAARSGQVHVHFMENGTRAADTVLNLNTAVSGFSGAVSELGLLGMTFSPTDSSRLFIFYTTYGGGQATSHVAEFEVTNGTTGSPTVDPTPYPVSATYSSPRLNHKAGWIGFDGSGALLVAYGDGGGQGDPDENGQNFATAFGSILRLDVDTPGPRNGSVVPSDNPWANDDSAGHLPETWATGFRNPWRCSVNDIKGEEVFLCADVGQTGFEEVSVIEGGDNAGWNEIEGHCAYASTSAVCAPEGYKAPVVSLARFSSWESIIGGYMLTESYYPSHVHGLYVFSDWDDRGFTVANSSTGDQWEMSGGCQTAPVNGFDDGTVDYVHSHGRDGLGAIYQIRRDSIWRLDVEDGPCNSTTYPDLCCSSRTQSNFYECTSWSGAADVWDYPGCPGAVCTPACEEPTSVCEAGNTCRAPICSVSCGNNGMCTDDDFCTCDSGYGFDPASGCIPVCDDACLNGGLCSAPNNCTCVEGYFGDQCEQFECDVICAAFEFSHCPSGPECACLSGYEWEGGVPESTCVPVLASPDDVTEDGDDSSANEPNISAAMIFSGIIVAITLLGTALLFFGGSAATTTGSSTPTSPASDQAALKASDSKTTLTGTTI